MMRALDEEREIMPQSIVINVKGMSEGLVVYLICSLRCQPKELIIFRSNSLPIKAGTIEFWELPEQSRDLMGYAEEKLRTIFGMISDGAALIQSAKEFHRPEVGKYTGEPKMRELVFDGVARV